MSVEVEHDDEGFGGLVGGGVGVEGGGGESVGEWGGGVQGEVGWCGELVGLAVVGDGVVVGVEAVGVEGGEDEEVVGVVFGLGENGGLG
jgi:hypothetical protein